MSFDFKTPGRSTSTAIPSGKSSSRRVVRSALEQVLDTASPDLENERVVARQALMQSQSSKPAAPKLSSDYSSLSETRFTVSYTAAPQRKSGESTVDSDRFSRNKVLTEEPSALLFLSPNQNKRLTSAAASGNSRLKRTGKNSRAADNELESAQHQKVRRTTNIRNTILSSPPSTKRSLLEDVEHARELSPDTEHDALPNERTFIYEEEMDEEEKSTSDASHSSSEKALFSQREMDDSVKNALAVYEKQRDEEETRILEQVGAEVEQQNVRYAALQKTHEAISAEKEVLHTQLQKMVVQYEALQETAHALREELHDEREKANRMTVELCHSADAHKLTQQEQRKWEKKQAEWSTMRQELEDNVESLRAQLESKSDEAAQLANERDDLEIEVEKLREARHQFDDDCNDIHARMAELGDCMASMETELRQKDDTIQRLQKKLSSQEKSHTLQKESEAESLEKLHKMEESLQQQTDEVRKKMYRITVLEKERTELRRTSRLASETLDTFAERLEECQRALHGLDATVRAQLVKDKKGGGASRTHSKSLAKHLISNDEEVSPSTTAEQSEDEATLSDDGSHDSEVGLRREAAARARSAEPAYRRQLGKSAARAHTVGPVDAGTTRGTVNATSLENKAKTLSHIFTDCLRLIQRIEDNMRSFQRRMRSTLTQTHRSESAKQEKVEEQYTEQIGKLEDACRYLKMQLGEKEKQLKEQHTECELRGQDLETMEKHTQHVRTQLASAEKQLSEAIKEKEKEQELRVELAQRVQRCEEELHHTALRLTAADEERAKLEVLHKVSEGNSEALAKVRVDLDECRSQLDRATNDKVVLVEAKQLLEEQLARARSEKETALSQQKEAQEQLRLARSGQEESQRSRAAELSHLRETVASLTALQEAMQSQHEKDVRELKAANASLAASAEEYQSNVLQYRRRLSETLSDLSLLQGSERTTLQAIVELLEEADPTFVAGSTAVAADSHSALATDTSSNEPSPLSTLLQTPRVNETADALSTTHLPASPAGIPHDARAKLLQSKRLRRQVVAAVQRAVLEIARLRAKSFAASAAAPPHYTNTVAATMSATTERQTSQKRAAVEAALLSSSAERSALPCPGSTTTNHNAVEYEEMFDDYYGGLGAGRTLFSQEASPFARTPGGPAANGSPSPLANKTPFIYHHGGVPHASVFRSALSPSPAPDTCRRSTGGKSLSFSAQRRSSSAGGLSASRGGYMNGAVDGSVSPARPPMLSGFAAA